MLSKYDELCFIFYPINSKKAKLVRYESKTCEMGKERMLLCNQ